MLRQDTNNIFDLTKQIHSGGDFTSNSCSLQPILAHKTNYDIIKQPAQYKLPAMKLFYLYY